MLITVVCALHTRSFIPHNNPVGFNYLTFQLRKPKLQKGKSFTQGHTASPHDAHNHQTGSLPQTELPFFPFTVQLHKAEALSQLPRLLPALPFYNLLSHSSSSSQGHKPPPVAHSLLRPCPCVGCASPRALLPASQPYGQVCILPLSLHSVQLALLSQILISKG